MRSALVFALSFLFYSGFGQSPQKISIQTGENKTFNLSEIAEQIHSIMLKMDQTEPFDVITDVLWTKEYLFVSVSSIEFQQQLPARILQYDHKGNFIRRIGEQGERVGKLLCDTLTNRLFISKNKSVYCYDFGGKQIDTYLLSDSPDLYDNGYFWIKTSKPQKEGKGVGYILSNYSIQTAKENILFNLTDHNVDSNGAFVARPASFSLRNNTPVVSFGIDNTLYQIHEKSVSPVIKFTIDKPTSVMVDTYGYQFQGFIGNYLCIHYLRNMQRYLYLKNMNTGKIFQTKQTESEGIKDDMLNTGFCKIIPLNRSQYFYFVKKDSKPNLPDVIEHTIYFVKLKP